MSRVLDGPDALINFFGGVRCSFQPLATTRLTSFAVAVVRNDPWSLPSQHDPRKDRASHHRRCGFCSSVRLPVFSAGRAEFDGLAHRWANQHTYDWLVDWMKYTETTFEWFLRDCSEVSSHVVLCAYTADLWTSAGRSCELPSRPLRARGSFSDPEATGAVPRRSLRRPHGCPRCDSSWDPQLGRCSRCVFCLLRMMFERLLTGLVGL